ncbi:MAG: hypothetical protein E6G04_09100 [Actinobacteria bacterium]|nr:MAG: hypothetical protein E6G04_09100 [Actinomycetota bacterium]
MSFADERLKRISIGVLILAAGALFAVPMRAHLVASSQQGMVTATFRAQDKELDERTPLMAGLYQPNTDMDALRNVRQAQALSAFGGAWKNKGPFGGIADIPGTGSGNELFLPVGGIGTAAAVDPSDKTGNTVYLGTHGGLFRSTDGGKHLVNITDGKVMRDGIGSVAVDPTDPKTIYVGTGVALFTLSDDQVGTGVYVSHNRGATFTRPVANTHGYGVTAITVSPNGTVFAGTNYGLWRSTDHGASFQKIALPDNAAHTGPAALPLGSWVTAIAVRPHHPNEVTVAVGYAFGKKPFPNGTVVAPGNGLYRSTSNGKAGTFTYLPSTSKLTNALASDDPIGRISLAYGTAPGTDNILWALVSDAGRAEGDTLLDTPTLPEGLSLTGNSVLNGLYRSGDDGGGWQLEATAQTLSTSPGAVLGPTYPLIGIGYQADYNNWLLTDPTNPDRIYVGLEETFQGDYHDPTGALPVPTMTWTTIEKYANLCGFLTYFNTIPNNNGIACPDPLPFYGGGTTHPDQHGAAIASTPNGIRLYSGNDGGWWAQDSHSISVGGIGFDNNTWRSLNSPSTVLPWDVTFLQDGSIVLALQDNGVTHIKNGKAYQVCGGDGVYVFPGANANSYYCGIDGQTILATKDDFKHTINVTPGLNGATFLSPWMVDRSNPNHLIAAASDIAETTAGPDTNQYDPTQELLLNSAWKTVFTPPTVPTGPWDSSAVYTAGPVSYVALCSTCRPKLADGSVATPEKVHAAIATNVAPKCKAAEASTACWHMAKGKGLPHQQISGIAVDPHDPKTIYVTLRQYLLLEADPARTGVQKVMVSHDAGNTFTDITGDLPRADAHAIAWRDGGLIVANDVGIFISKAGSGRWHRLGTGLPQVPFRSMKLDQTGRYVLGGAYGRGAWVFDFGAKATISQAVVPGHAPRATSASTRSSSAGPASGGSSPITGTQPTAVEAKRILAETGLPAATVVPALLMLMLAAFITRSLRRVA